MNVFQENALWMEEIFKDHVKKEKFAQKNWKKEHGYIMEEIHEMEEKLKKIDAEKEKICRKSDEVKAAAPKPKKHQPPPVPLTTSEMIGWRSTDPRYNLEKYKKSNKNHCKGDIVAKLKWPREGI